MNIISKTIKGQEYLYSTRFVIECKSEKQAQELANHLNNNNETAQGIFKLNGDEKWHAYQVDEYSGVEAQYKLIKTKGCIKVKRAY